MVKDFLGRKRNLISFKRTKPGIGPEHHTTSGRRLTQFGFGACSSGTLIHLAEPRYV